MAPCFCTLRPQNRLEKSRYSFSFLQDSFSSLSTVTPSRLSCHRKEPMKPSPAPVVSTALTFWQGAKAWEARV